MDSADNTKSNKQSVILIADDDDLCLDVGVKMLQKLGYEVLDARDGKEAIEVFSNNKDNIQLVILDMKMPHNGSTTFDKLKKINADVKVLIASGYTEDRRIREMKKQGCCGFIQKPFRLSTLTEQITNALKN